MPDLPAIRFGSEICQNLAAATQREWLETNGLGGFASSTIAGLNTRRYHGLLTAATKPPVGRLVLLSKFEETVIIGNQRFELSANRYPGVVHPRGQQYLKEFRLDPFPVFTYAFAGVELEKRVFMVHDENTTVVEYELRTPTPEPCVLELRPLIAFRDYHSLTHENGALNPALQMETGLVTISPYPDLPALRFIHNADEVQAEGSWYRNFEYSAEQERGLDYREDSFCPFVAKFHLTSARSVASVIATIETAHRTAEDAAFLRKSELQRRNELIATLPSGLLKIKEPLIQRLASAADQFIVKRGHLKTIIAGYHWFSDWGRDTMIALPGLALVTGRYEIAKNILLAFANSIDQGMLPNRFPDAGETPEYNTVDATLWFFEATRAYRDYAQDADFVREQLYPKLKEIIDWHIRGTRYGIRMDADGLLNCGEPGVQLTWMDAKIGDWVVTPRYGKPVEIQALWYNALRIVEAFAGEFDPAAQASYAALADRARNNFQRLFWNEATECLFDVVNGDACDAAIRPNQIFAVSLPHTMLAPVVARQVVDAVQRELLTPTGLRSLSPRDSQYHAHYEGGVWERDSAYHQGTVWPWLMGPFITAFVKVNGSSAGALAQAAQWLSAFEQQMWQFGLGQIAEIADGDAPHRARGCIAQAWSIAELLRAAVEDVFVPSQSSLKRE